MTTITRLSSPPAPPRACCGRLLLSLVLGSGLLACTGPSYGPHEPRPTGALVKSVLAGDSTPIMVEELGVGSPALVFVHGWCLDRTMWTRQLVTIAPDHRVVLVDLPGHGESGRERASWAMLDYGRDLLTVLVELELEDAILIGHSMGAPVCLEAARLAPDRVRGVIGVDALHDAGRELDGALFDSLIAAYEADFEGTCREGVAVMFTGSSESALIEQVTRQMCGSDPEIALPLFRSFRGYDLAEALAAVDVPLRAVNADMQATNIEANRVHAPDYDVRLIEGAGHFLMLEHPHQFNDALAWAVEDLMRATAGGGDPDRPRRGASGDGE